MNFQGTRNCFERAAIMDETRIRRERELRRRIVAHVGKVWRKIGGAK